MADARAMRWDDHTGWLLASPRHEGAWAVVQDGDRLVLVGDPLHVPDVLQDVPGAAETGVFQARLRWSPLTSWLRRQLLELAEDDLIPPYDVQHVRNAWVPYLSALAMWDTLEVTGDVDGDTLRIEGRLAAQRSPE
jgi:hypothetical protein